MAKLTPWFPADVKPVRVGVYEVRREGLKAFKKWNGQEWLCFSSTVDEADSRMSAFKSCQQREEWRGLASAPKARP